LEYSSSRSLRWLSRRRAAAEERRRAVVAAEAAKASAAFVDIGTVNSLGSIKSTKPAEDMPDDRGGKIEMRIDLGRGLMLQIVRH